MPNSQRTQPNGKHHFHKIYNETCQNAINSMTILMEYRYKASFLSVASTVLNRARA